MSVEEDAGRGKKKNQRTFAGPDATFNQVASTQGIIWA